MAQAVRTWLANTGLLLLSLMACFAMGELVLRFLNSHALAEQAAMYSSPAFQFDRHGAVRYVPNEDIRAIAVYNGIVAYDVRFHTNNIGLIDRDDYRKESDPGKSYYAFVGDSFSAGYHGGEPWIPRLRKQQKSSNVEIYNLGVDGTGITQFHKLLQSASEQLRITHIVILGISNDFQRGPWYPLTSLSEIRFCREHLLAAECLAAVPIVARVIPPSASTQDVLRIAASMAEERKRTRGVAERGGGEWNVRDMLRNSQLLVSAGAAVRKVAPQAPFGGEVLNSLESLRKIKETFPDSEIHFIHLPEKQEVARAKYDLEAVGKAIAGIGIAYFPALKACQWSEEMFFVHDPHPNGAGYENISGCVSRYLFGQRHGAKAAKQ